MTICSIGPKTRWSNGDFLRELLGKHQDSIGKLVPFVKFFRFLEVLKSLVTFSDGWIFFLFFFPIIKKWLRKWVGICHTCVRKWKPYGNIFKSNFISRISIIVPILFLSILGRRLVQYIGLLARQPNSWLAYTVQVLAWWLSHFFRTRKFRFQPNMDSIIIWRQIWIL